MPDRPHFLTEPQWRILTYATRMLPREHPQWGKISCYYTHQKSLDALLKHQMIAPGPDVRGIKERHELSKRLGDTVTDARHLLQSGNWREALTCLQRAEAYSQALAKKAYWVTDSALSWLT